MINLLESVSSTNLSLNTPKIYVACLSSYNLVYLHGSFIDATQEPEDIRDEIQYMLSLSPVADLEACEDYAIHDFEGFEGINLHEHESIDYVSALAQALEIHGKAFALYVDYLGLDNIAQALTDFEDKYCGCYESAEDYARDFYEQTGQLDTIEQAGLNSFYINWKAIAHDWQCNGDYLFLDESLDKIHVFYNH